MTRLLPKHPQSNPSATLEQLLGSCTVPVGLLQGFLEVFDALLRDHNGAPRVPVASAAPVKQQALLIWLQLLCLCVVSPGIPAMPCVAGSLCIGRFTFNSQIKSLLYEFRMVWIR